MATAREMREKATVQACVADILEVGSQVNGGAYENLCNATPEELLEATIWSYRQSVNSPDMTELAVMFLRSGFALAQPGGWERVAPHWLRESRKEKE